VSLRHNWHLGWPVMADAELWHELGEPSMNSDGSHTWRWPRTGHQEAHPQPEQLETKKGQINHIRRKLQQH